MDTEPDYNSTDSRRSDRRCWTADVLFRAGTRKANVKLSDISKLGARVHGVFLVHEGDMFFVKLPGMESIEAKVVWVTDFEFGCEFLRPLSEVVLDALISNRR
jgi:PilZ domain